MRKLNFRYALLTKVLNISLENVLKFQSLVACQQGIDKIRLPLKKQYDQGLPCLQSRLVSI